MPKNPQRKVTKKQKKTKRNKFLEIKSVKKKKCFLEIIFLKDKKRSRLIYAFSFALDAALATMIVRITAIIVTSIA